MLVKFTHYPDRSVYNLGNWYTPENINEGIANVGKHYYDTLTEEIKELVNSRQILLRMKLNDNGTMTVDLYPAVQSDISLLNRRLVDSLEDSWIGLLIHVGDGGQTVYGLDILSDDMGGLLIPDNEVGLVTYRS